MSLQATQRAWASSAGATDLLVLLALADFAGGGDDPFDHAYPSVARLAARAKVSPRTVHRSLRSLEEAGIIRSTGRHDWGGGKVTVQYRIEVVETPDGRGDNLARGDTGDADGVTPVSPNPSYNPPFYSSSPKGRADATGETSPAEGSRTLPSDDVALTVLVAGILQRGIDSLSGSWPRVTPRAVADAIEGVTRQTGEAPSRRRVLDVAQEARAIAQSQDRAPNLARLFGDLLAGPMAIPQRRPQRRATPGDPR